MGSGCSSPLRRLGGKKSKQTQRDSISEIINDDGNPEQLTIAAKIKAGQTRRSSERLDNNQKGLLNLENETTIQSEANEEHPSSASYYIDGKNQTKTNITTTDEVISNPIVAQNGPVARMMGLSGAIPYDRHLLVSPALSPAPSLCQSPAPFSTFAGCPMSLDLNDLDEAFSTLTFGLTDDQTEPKIKRQTRRVHSEFYNYYNHQLIQSCHDLVQNISIVFIAADNNIENVSKGGYYPDFIDLLSSRIETSLRSICDDRSFNLRFLDLSQDQLSENLYVNNIQDVAAKLLEEEFKENGNRMLVIMLANCNLSPSLIDQKDCASKQQTRNDKRQMPTKMDIKLMNKLLNYDETLLCQETKDLLRIWYDRVGNTYYLNPIYIVNPKISSKSKDEREQAWQSWLTDSATMFKSLVSICDNDTDLGEEIQLHTLFSKYVDFLSSELSLQRRTLLIRNYPGQMSNQQGQQMLTADANKLNELARLLADTCKFTMKHNPTEDEFGKLVIDWINDYFGKYIDSLIENRTIQGKYVPPFVERNLFIELTRQRHHLEHYLDNIAESFESKCLNFYTTQIQPLLMNNNTEDMNDTNIINNSSSSRQSLNSQPSANHLVFISGPKGCGKTTLFAQLVKYIAQDFTNKLQVLYRFCGSTIDSLNSNRLLRSICEQFCQIRGENTTAASYIYSSRRKELLDAIGKIVKTTNVLVFLDGIDAFKDPIETCLDWLCEIEASPHIKIIMTLETNSELYNKMLSLYSDATFISLNNPTSGECAHMLKSMARTNRLNSTDNLYDELKQLPTVNDDSNNINFEDTFDLLNMCRIRVLNNEHKQPEISSEYQANHLESFKNVHQIIFSYLEYLSPPYILGAFFVALATSRNGLTEIEITDILSLVSRKYYDTKQNKLRFPQSLLSYLKFHLRPWLKVIICDKIVKFTIRNDLLKRALDNYVASTCPKVIGDVREAFESYYSRPFKQNKRGSKGSIINDLTDSLPKEIKDYTPYCESIWLETQASEMMNLYIHTNPSKAKSNILSKHTFYLQFLRRSIPEEFIEDYDKLRAISNRKLSQSEEIQNLVNYIRQSIFPLRYDGNQIYSQIYCRSFENNKSSGKALKNKKYNDIISMAMSPPIWSLLPISEVSIDSFIKTRIGQAKSAATPTLNNNGTTMISSNLLDSQRCAVLPSGNQTQKQPYGPSNSYQQSSKQKIFTIKDNHRHVIAIYPDKNCLAVWDIFEEQPVRTINDIDHPRDLRMIDQKRAVILCNRELRVYDLNSGTLLTNLKGVMNQKMPYFEIFGQDYVVALARNRMYVNMLNINTGELETTFKVGEDRFLNSLLVSANGGICVCGDETQKPFPLLVWNLNERRLMYDLRLERHEFITRMSAISDDGHYVVSVCKQLGDNVDSSSSGSTSTPSISPNIRQSPNFIVVYDLNSGTLFKKWKPGLDTCGVAISLSSNRSGKLINSIIDSSIIIWDLTTGSKKHTLIGHNAPADIIRIQNNRIFSMDSTCRDQSLRIWDLEEGYCMAVFSPDAPISSCQMSTRGDALVCGFATEFRLSTLVMCKNETVNEVVKRNKRRKSSKSSYIFDEPSSRKQSS